MPLEQIDRLICQLTEWDRDTLVTRFLSYPSRFPVDATPEFLAALSVDRLRHVFLALCLQNGRLPDPVAALAA